MKMSLDKNYWNERYLQQETGWDLKQASPPLVAYINQLNDKSISILIPGCGNAHEAEYLLQQGFTNITLIDIAPTLVEQLQQKFKNNPNIQVICADFFEHQNQYDLILEQTLFCAINPQLREKYVQQAQQLLKPKGKLVGVLFNTVFEKEGPPFGGYVQEYKSLFQPYFQIKTLEPCHNSFVKRAGTEVFINFQKA